MNLLKMNKFYLDPDKFFANFSHILHAHHSVISTSYSALHYNTAIAKYT